MGSFNSKTFMEGKAPGFPVWDKKDILAIKPLAASTTPVIQEIGMDVQRVGLTVRCTGAQLADLYDQVLESGSLVVAWETHNAFLESISNVEEQGAGHDTYFATLNLIRL